MRLLDLASPQLALVFCATKQMRTDLAGELQSRGYRAEALHGDMTQEQRESVMDAPRGGRLEEHAEAALVAQVDRVLVGGEWRPSGRWWKTWHVGMTPLTWLPLP
jgi:hypothetical protein